MMARLANRALPYVIHQDAAQTNSWQAAMKRIARRKSRNTRFRPRIETLERRRVLAAAIDLAAINGRVFDDFTGNGFDLGEEVSGASLQLFLDDGDGVFEPGTGDTSVGSTTTDANGNYDFGGLTVGNYFVLQPTQNVAGTQLQQSVSPLITINASDVQGQISTSIDTFDTGTQQVNDISNDGTAVTSVLQTVDAIGGERDLAVNLTSTDANSEIELSVNLTPGALSFDSQRQGDGVFSVSWDGIDGDANNINDAGLNVDLSNGGSAQGLSLQIGSDAGGNATIRLYTDDGNPGTANRFSSATIPIPDTGGGVGTAEFIPFSSFIASGGGVDLTNVGAIELVIDGPANTDGRAELVGALEPTTFAANFDNFETADLAVNKTVNDTSPSTNQNVTFTITVDNNGPDIATGVAVTDQLPAGISYVSDSPSQGDYDPLTGIWTVGTINNQEATLLLVGLVTSATADVITNTAQITASDQMDPIASNNQSSASLTPEQIDIGINKGVSNLTPNTGDMVTFTVSANNMGPSNATNVVIADVLPAGLTFVNFSATSGSYDVGTGLWTVGAINSGTAAVLTLVATVNTNGTVTNTASFSSADQTDSNPANNQDSVSITPAQADLSLTKQVNSSAANVGENVTFTITVSNAGPNDATGVAVTDVLPVGLSFVNAIPAGAYNPGNGIWTVGNVANGTSQTLELIARVDSIGAQINTAQISAADQSDPDSTPGNNASGEDDQASATVTAATADLSLEKGADSISPNVGDDVTFTIVVSNAGPNNATDVVVLDAIPAGLTFVSDNAGGAYNPVTGLWNVGTVISGQSRALNITARVDASSTITNTAQVQSVNEFDPDSTPGNDVAGEDDQDAVTLSPASADLSLTKSVSSESPNVNVNEQVTFTVTVTNSGPNEATGVSVLDQLPAGTSFVSATPSQGDYDQGTGVWTVGSINTGSNATLSLIAIANTPGLITNTAEVLTADQQDPDSTPGNNVSSEDDQASAQITAAQVDLSVTKTVNNSTPNVGSEVIFTITVNNGGPSTATGVVVSESLPPGVTLINSSPSQGSFNTATGAWTVGSLLNGGQATINLTARVDNPGTGINTAQVTAVDQFDVDSTPSNNLESEDDQASVTFTTPIADLSLTKTVSESSPNVGETVSFLITVTNDGPDNATGVSIQDTLPAGLSFVSNNLSAGTFNPASGVWTVGGLANGASANLEILARVDAQGATTNSAQVIAVDQSDPDSTPGNNIAGEDDQDSASLTPAVVDISLTKTASVARPAVGENVTFTVSAANAGPDAASGVVITDLLPAGLTFIGSTPSVGAYNAATGIWTVGAIASGTTATIDIVARVDQLGERINTAELTSLDQFDVDSTAGNNVPGEDDQASVTITPASADLSLTKIVDDPSPNVGQSITFTLTVSNAGPDAASNVLVRDNLPPGVTFQSSSPTVGTYDQATGIWTIPTVAVGSTETLQLNAIVDTPGDQTNSAEIIASSQLDPDSTPDNNNAGEDDQASAVFSPELVDLALTKTVSDLTPNLGDTITYTLTLANDGPSSATGVQVTDQLPAGVTFNSATQTAGTYNSATGVWTVGEVVVGASPTLNIIATVGNTLGETNTAEITAVDQPDVDSTPGNNDAGEDDQASTSFTTQVADLSLTKTVNIERPTQAENVQFTLSLANAGPDDATEIVVNDLLPSGLRFVSSTPSVGTYDATAGTWSVANLPNGSTATLLIEAAVTSAEPSTNIAEVASVRQFDPDSTPGNSVTTEDDFDTAVVTPLVVDISVSASVDNPEPLEGDIIQFVFTALNSGPDDATGVNLSTLLPLGFTLISSQPQSGTYNTVTGDWDIGGLASGATTQLTLNAQVDTRGVTEVPIEVISTNEFDVDSTPNNSVDSEDDQAAVVVRAPRLLTKRLFISR